ncbi:MAG: Maf family protein [Planctomycetota bacterium]|jgi:septum formation protein
MDLPHFILASASPRRKKLLEDAGFDFEVEASAVEESSPGSGDPVEVVVLNALMKARDIASRHSSGIVVGADTVVSFDDKIIGKPADAADAKRILNALSGTRHTVITGVAIVDVSAGRVQAFAEKTFIEMRKMSADEIEQYVSSGEALGKAGAYAIQETGDRFIEKVDGSFSNVVGFPVEAFRKKLEDIAGGPHSG